MRGRVLRIATSKRCHEIDTRGRRTEGEEPPHGQVTETAGDTGTGGVLRALLRVSPTAEVTAETTVFTGGGAVNRPHPGEEGTRRRTRGTDRKSRRRRRRSIGAVTTVTSGLVAFTTGLPEHRLDPTGTTGGPEGEARPTHTTATGVVGALPGLRPVKVPRLGEVPEVKGPCPALHPTLPHSQEAGVLHELQRGHLHLNRTGLPETVAWVTI